jgi:hypothetical protein
MPEKLKPCPACGAPYPRMVEHEMFAYVACDTIGCCLSGPVAETEEGAVRKWNTLARSPRRLRWTKEPPKEPGYYWHEEDHEKQPVHVFHGATQEGEISLYAQFFNEGYEVHKIERMSGKWAGPIPEPEE